MSKVTAGVELDDLTDEVSGLTYSVNDADKVLQKYGIFMTDSQGQMRDLGDVLDEVGGKWGTMTRLEQNQLSYVLAGARQRNIFTAAMNDWNTVLDAEQVALNSAGTAEEKMAVFTESLEAAQNKLTAAWQSFVTGTNVDKVFIAAYKAGALFLNILDLLLNKIPVLSTILRTVLLVNLTSITVSLGKSALTALSASKAIGTLKTVLASSTGGFTAFNTGLMTIITNASFYTTAVSYGATATQAFVLSIAGLTAVFLPLVLVMKQAFDIIKDSSIESARNKLESTNQEISDTTSKISELSSKIDELNSEMVDLQNLEKNGNITLVQKDKLGVLKEQTKELENQKEIQEAMLKDETSRSLSEQGAVTSKSLSGANLYDTVGNLFTDGYTPTGFAGFYTDQDYQKGIGLVTNDIDSIIDSYQKLSSAGDSLTKDQQQNLSIFSKNLEEKFKDTQDFIDKYNAAQEAGIDVSSYKEQYDQIKKEHDKLLEVLYPETYKKIKVEELFDMPDFDTALTNAKQKIEDLQKEFSSGAINKESFDNQLNDIATSLASDTKLKDALTEIFGTDAMQDFSSVVATIAEQLNNQLGGALGNTARSMDEVNKSIDTIQSSFDTVNNAVEEYNQYGGLSADNLQAILGLSDEYIDALSIENGKLSVNGQAIDNIVQAKLEDAKVTATQQYMTELESIANGDAASSAAAATYATQAQGEASAELANVLGITTGAVYNFANANDLLSKYNAALKKDTNATAKATERYKKKLALIDSTAQGSGSSFKKLSNVLGGYSASAQKASEKTQKLQTELKDSQEDITNLLEMTEKMLKQQYEDQKKSLDDSLDVFEKKIDAQKELLDLQQKEEEHAKKIADYNKQTGDYQA